MFNPLRYRNLKSFLPWMNPAPVYCLFEVTNRCNIRCRMCSLWKRGDKTRELTLDQIQKAADNLKRIGVILVSLTGGEPFLRADLPEIIRIFKTRGFMVRVLTNGTLAREDMLQKAVDAGLDNVSVSFDTLNPGLMEKITGSSTAWKNTLKTMSIISQLMTARKTIPLLNVVVSRYNYTEIPEIARFADAIGFYSSFIPVQVAESEDTPNLFEDYAPEMKFTPIDIDRLQSSYEQLLELKRKKFRILNSTRFLRESPGFLMGNGFTLRCHVGSLYFLVDHEGRIAPCHAFEGKMLAFQENFVNHYRSLQLEGFFDHAIQACAGCMHPCWIELSLMCDDRKSMMEAVLLNIKPQPKRAPLTESQVAALAEEHGKNVHYKLNNSQIETDI